MFEKLIFPPVDLDAAAGEGLSPQMAARYTALLAQYPHNPHGVTAYAARARAAADAAARSLLAVVGAQECDAQVIWCASATEALNLGIRGVDVGEGAVAGDESAHAAVIAALKNSFSPAAQRWFHLDAAGGVTGWRGNGDDSKIRLAVLPLVNSETGVIWDGDRTAFPAGTTLLLDAAQALGRHPLPWSQSGVDMMVLSGRKIGAPPGIAALVCRRELPLKPVIYGGGQQDGLRSGTLDVAAAVAFAEAAAQAEKNRYRALEVVKHLNGHCRRRLQEISRGKWVLFSPPQASPYILFFGIPGYDGAVVARLLAEENGVLVGTGSACSAESREISPALRAAGVDEKSARGAIRLSFTANTTLEEIDTFLDKLQVVLREY